MAITDTIWCMAASGKSLCTPSIHQVARNETAESLIPLSFPTPSFCSACG